MKHRIAFLVFLILFLLSACGSRSVVEQESPQVSSESDNVELPAGAYISAHPELVLDSSISETDKTSDEIVDMINGIDPGSIDEAFVYINSGTRTGKSFDFSTDIDDEELKVIASIIFNDKITYAALQESEEFPAGYSRNYDFYITYKDRKTNMSITVFVFNGCTVIRVDGLYLKASSPLDNVVFNDVIKRRIFNQ